MPIRPKLYGRFPGNSVPVEMKLYGQTTNFADSFVAVRHLLA
jgi:hypothetical protein